ncbi:MAG: hypothetical protein ACTHKU_13060 [Verrucomicrobiota bacterium]
MGRQVKTSFDELAIILLRTRDETRRAMLCVPQCAFLGAKWHQTNLGFVLQCDGSDHGWFCRADLSSWSEQKTNRCKNGAKMVQKASAQFGLRRNNAPRPGFQLHPYGSSRTVRLDAVFNFHALGIEVAGGRCWQRFLAVRDDAPRSLPENPATIVRLQFPAPWSA